MVHITRTLTLSGIDPLYSRRRLGLKRNPNLAPDLYTSGEMTRLEKAVTLLLYEYGVFAYLLADKAPSIITLQRYANLLGLLLNEPLDTYEYGK